jgi:hypothetical protein
MHVSQIYFGIKLYIFRTDLLYVIRSHNNILPAIGICHYTYVDRLLTRSEGNIRQST